MTHVTCRLTAKNRDQLRNPAFGIRIWVTCFARTCNFCVSNLADSIDERRFYLRDAMLARVLAMTLAVSVHVSLSVCLSVSVSVTSRRLGVLSKRMDRLICFLAWGFFRSVIYCVLRKFRYLQNKGTSVWNFFKTRTKKISPRHIDRRKCYQLSSRKCVIKWTVVSQLS